jgi:indolepyruvate ferredoxin oxidoreductase alpha subunit
MRRKCALIQLKDEKPPYEVKIDEEKCMGENCGCNRFCTRVFKCPGLIWDKKAGKSKVDDVLCVGCGVCADICPEGAIIREEAS